MFVVDGGNNKNDIVLKLRKQTANIDVVICTHYDSDHFNGIIGIIKSNKFHIKELWLPDILGDIVFTLYHHPEYAIELLSMNKTEEESQITLENFIAERSKETNKKEQNDIGERINISFLEYLHELLQCRFCLFPYSKAIANIKCIVVLKKILHLIIYAIYSGTHIRWLEYKAHRTKERISNNYNLYALNSSETNMQAYHQQHLFYLALYVLSKENKESLVFQFEKENLPNVLFTADSDLGFCKQTGIQLTDNSIVTAPHHGSPHNACVYQIVQGNNLIYVRSGKVKPKWPCKEYINLPQKYCTDCRNSTNDQQVILKYKSNIQRWVPINTFPCICKGRRP